MELHKYWGVGGRRCGGCEAAPAAVHCRSCPGGGAFLCTACDARPAHARLGHERVWMCEVCELAPAAVTCKADAAVLCAACDADIHDANPLARRHARVPVAPIGSEAAAAVEGSSSEVGVVPEAFGDGGGAGSFELDFTRPKPQAYMPYTATPQSHSVSSVDVEAVPERGDMAAARPVPLVGESREARLMRYREKRKNRRFEKTIRYASRKAYAETRPRIKGRFAKRADHDGDGDADDAEAEAAVPSSSYVLDFGYGVVPSF